MSLRQLVEGDCGGVNPLMQLGGQFTRDVARKDEGFMQPHFERSMRPDEQMVNEFLGQVSAPPQSFQMNTLLQEMREIEQNATSLHAAPRVIDEVTAGQWSKEYGAMRRPPPQILHMRPQQQQTTYVREFFDDAGAMSVSLMSGPRFMGPSMMQPQLAICPPYASQTGNSATEQFFNEAAAQSVHTEELSKDMQAGTMEDWVKDFQANNAEAEQKAANYNENFWQRLQDEWQKMSEDPEHPWLSEISDTYDPYTEYAFAEENPMSDLSNAFEKGKEYLAQGDIPSAVLCFEVAAKKDPENAEIWELLGLSQAENEMDPQSIAALKRSLQLRSENPRVLMALAVCYTNESLQSHALKMLINWLQINPKYKHLVQHSEMQVDGGPMLASSLIRGSRLEQVQNMFLDAVRINPGEIDAEVQEALGVLYNLSSEFDKAVDCFRAALHVSPQNAKLWNRLGASLANGSRSVEAVEAYQRALQLEPGFIRVRYNVGVCCMNLKAYQQAVEHLLTALNMQANSAAQRDIPGAAQAAANFGQQRMSESIWSTLRMVISLMGRNDLQGAVTDRNLDALNQAFKD